MGQEATRPWRSELALSLWCAIAAFGTYFCMYAFRKPFTAATFADLSFLGVGYKTALVAAQVAGYTLSKFLGIKVIAEMRPERRAIGILVLIGIAEIALLGFGLFPPPYNLVCLFLNGLPLGMVFGLVMGFLEGRRVTEALTAALCASFILSSGVVKSVGVWLLKIGVSEGWMPAVACLIFTFPLLLFVAMLTRIPPPSSTDVALRSARTPMTAADRWSYFRRHALGLSLLVLMYLLITILRSIRDDFGVELWAALGNDGEPSVFTWSETWVTLGVLVVNGAAFLIEDNRRGFFAAMATALGGTALLVLGLLGLSYGILGAFPFMVIIGLGLYLPYVAVHTTLFERLIALLRDRGNIGYLMYLADAIGYLGYVAVMVVKNFVRPGATPQGFLEFFLAAAWVGALGSAVALLLAWFVFARTTAPKAQEVLQEATSNSAL